VVQFQVYTKAIMKIRKPVDQITLEDLRKHPVWEYANDEECVEGQDETTVRPCKTSGALDPVEERCMVRAKFTLADGTVMQGMMTLPGPSEAGLGILQPVIITDAGRVLFWHGTFAPEAKELKMSYKILGRDATKVFPIQVVTDVELVGGELSTTIPGFMVLTNWKTGKTKAVK
jgi:hypothetical protein